MRGFSMFKQKQPLPSPQCQLTVDDGYRLGASREYHPNVRRHIIGTFISVDEIGFILGHQPVKILVQIRPRVGVGVLHDDQRATGMLDKDRCDALLDTRLFEDVLNLVGDGVGAFATGRESNCVMMYVHR